MNVWATIGIVFVAIIFIYLINKYKVQTDFCKNNPKDPFCEDPESNYSFYKCIANCAHGDTKCMTDCQDKFGKW